MVPVLIGLQGAGKTSAVEALSPIAEAFVEINLEKKDDDIARRLRGKLVGEIAELRGLQSRDAEAIKAWVSRRSRGVDPEVPGVRPRASHGACCSSARATRTSSSTTTRASAAGCRCTWAGGREGASRPTAISCGPRACGSSARPGWHGKTPELAKAEHQKFKVGDPWQEPVAEWLERDDMDGPRSAGVVRTIDVLVSCLGFSVQKITRKDELRVAKVLRILGYEKSDKRLRGTLSRFGIVQKNAWSLNVQKTARSATSLRAMGNKKGNTYVIDS
jgi:hypothetical protein